jgi:hypothetical protein
MSAARGGVSWPQVWLSHRKNKDNSSLFTPEGYVKGDKVRQRLAQPGAHARWEIQKKGKSAWDLQPAFHSLKCHDPVTGEWREWFGP